jgi:hypothetical protein
MDEKLNLAIEIKAVIRPPNIFSISVEKLCRVSTKVIFFFRRNRNCDEICRRNFDVLILSNSDEIAS